MHLWKRSYLEEEQHVLSGRVKGSETEAAESDYCLASDSLRVNMFQGQRSDASEAVESQCFVLSK